MLWINYIALRLYTTDTKHFRCLCIITTNMVAQSLMTLALIGAAVAAPGGGPPGQWGGGQQWGGDRTEAYVVLVSMRNASSLTKTVRADGAVITPARLNAADGETTVNGATANRPTPSPGLLNQLLVPPMCTLHRRLMLRLRPRGQATQLRQSPIPLRLHLLHRRS